MPRPHHARRMNLIALSILITALIAFVAFHFLEITIYTDPELASMMGRDLGWEIWPNIVRFLKDADFDLFQGMIAVSAFLTYSILVIASPFIVPILRVSRISWWIVVVASGIAMCSFGGMILAGMILISVNDPSFSIPGPGLYCILASLALNFIGLLFIRREVPAAPEVDPA